MKYLEMRGSRATKMLVLFSYVKCLLKYLSNYSLYVYALTLKTKQIKDFTCMVVTPNSSFPKGSTI